MTSPLDVVRPHYFGGSLADVLPSALAVLGVDRAHSLGVGQAHPLGVSRAYPLGADAADPLGLLDQLAGVRRIAVLLVWQLARAVGLDRQRHRG